MIRKISAILILPLLIGLATPVQAQVEKITLRVDGLACPFCAYGLEKKLKKLDGHRSLKVLINEGKVVVEWRRDKPLNLANIKKAVDEAGFTLRGVKGVFVGTLTMEDEKFFLVLPKPLKQSFYLYEPSKIKNKDNDAHKHEGSADFLTETTRKRLMGLIKKGAAVKIFGPVHAHKGKGIVMAIGMEKLGVVAAVDVKPAKGN